MSRDSRDSRECRPADVARLLVADSIRDWHERVAANLRSKIDHVLHMLAIGLRGGDALTHPRSERLRADLDRLTRDLEHTELVLDWMAREDLS